MGLGSVRELNGRGRVAAYHRISFETSPVKVIHGK